jgi:YbbR domain-containing protein
MTSNLLLKLISIILAFLIWLYLFSGDKPVEKLIPIPLIVKSPPAELAMVTGVPDQVELYVNGPLSRVRQLEQAADEGMLKAVMDLRHGDKGKKAYPIHVSGANLRWMYRKTHPGPKLEVELEEFAETTVAPERLIAGIIEPGAYIESESGLPKTVRVRGAESLVKQLDRVVYRLTDADLVGYGNMMVDFIPQDANGRLIINLSITPPSAEIQIVVRKAGAEREVPVVYNLVGSPPPGYTITELNIDPLMITLEGPPDVLKDINRVETEPIDLSSRTDDITIPDLKLVQPHAQVRMSETTVRLDVRIAHKTSKRLIEGLPIQWDGGEELVLFYGSEPRVVNVTVAGPIDAINALDRDMIIPKVNVRGLAEGLHENRPVSVQILSPEISLVKVEPDAVMVRVKPREEFAIEGEGE